MGVSGLGLGIEEDRLPVFLSPVSDKAPKHRRGPTPVFLLQGGWTWWKQISC